MRGIPAFKVVQACGWSRAATHRSGRCLHDGRTRGSQGGDCAIEGSVQGNTESATHEDLPFVTQPSVEGVFFFFFDKQKFAKEFLIRARLTLPKTFSFSAQGLMFHAPPNRTVMIDQWSGSTSIGEVLSHSSVSVGHLGAARCDAAHVTGDRKIHRPAQDKGSTLRRQRESASENPRSASHPHAPPPPEQMRHTPGCVERCTAKCKPSVWWVRSEEILPRLMERGFPFLLSLPEKTCACEPLALETWARSK